MLREVGIVVRQAPCECRRHDATGEIGDATTCTAIFDLDNSEMAEFEERFGVRVHCQTRPPPEESNMQGQQLTAGRCGHESAIRAELRAKSWALSRCSAVRHPIRLCGM